MTFFGDVMVMKVTETTS